MNFFRVLFKLSEKLLGGVRIAEQILCLSVHFTASSGLDNLSAAAPGRCCLKINFSVRINLAGCWIGASRSGGILRFPWHRLGLNRSFGSFTLRGGRLLLVSLFGKMFLKSFGNFCLESFYSLVCLGLRWAKLLVVRSCFCSQRPGRTGIGTTETFQKLLYNWEFLDFFCHILHIFGT